MLCFCGFCCVLQVVDGGTFLFVFVSISYRGGFCLDDGDLIGFIDVGSWCSH